MKRAWHPVIVSLFFFGLVACGGSSGSGGGNPTSPTSPTTPTTPTNHAPAITGVNITPSFGISQLTAFAMSAAATDSDNDSLTYTWDFGDGTQSGGQNVTKTYTGGGAMTVRVTASDGKSFAGPTATGSDTRTLNVGTMTGRWKLTTTACSGMNQSFTMTLAQSGGTVTGTFEAPDGFCAAAKGSTGKTDPAEPGTIDVNGHVVIRFKVGAFIDFYFRGDMKAPGDQVVGGVFNSGFTGQNTTLDKIG